MELNKKYQVINKQHPEYELYATMSHANGIYYIRVTMTIACLWDTMTHVNKDVLLTSFENNYTFKG